MIINLTQHTATIEQKAEGVIELPAEEIELLHKLLTFKNLPTSVKINRRATNIAEIAQRNGAESAMIGGAPYLMSFLEIALKIRGITPLYAFTERESVEEIQQDGSIRKVNIFRHKGFVKV